MAGLGSIGTYPQSYSLIPWIIWWFGILQKTDSATFGPSARRVASPNRKSQGQKWLKPLSKRILDFALAKGKSAVEFRIKRTKTGHPAAQAKRRLRPAAPKVARARSSDAGGITSRPMLIGYARVSTVDQNLALQRGALTEAGCAKIFTEQMSGAVTDRPALHDDQRVAAAREFERVMRVEARSAGPVGCEIRCPAACRRLLLLWSA